MLHKNISITLTNADGLAGFTDSALIVLNLTREEVECGNIASALERLHILADTRESALRYRESLVFIVCGYDDDPRELAEIPHVRTFFARLAQEWPHWFWFLARDLGAISLFMSLLCTVKIHRSPGSFGSEFLDSAEMGAILGDLFERGNAIFYAYGITAQEANESAASAIAELLPE